jgi:hypothetical protein
MTAEQMVELGFTLDGNTWKRKHLHLQDDSILKHIWTPQDIVGFIEKNAESIARNKLRHEIKSLFSNEHIFLPQIDEKETYDKMYEYIRKCGTNEKRFELWNETDSDKFKATIGYSDEICKSPDGICDQYTNCIEKKECLFEK